MSYRIAVLDLGTNTFNLLLADMRQESYTIIYSDKLPVKIGHGGINEGFISQEAEKRAIKALAQHKKIIDLYKVDKIYGYATSAFRNATNGEALRDKINKKFGFDIKIIQGELEAKFIYFGVKESMYLGKAPVLIMDIGGGSVEFIIANDEKAFWKKSFEIGAQRLLDVFHHIDPIPQSEINNLEKYFNEMLPELFTQVKKHKVTTLVGSSGSFDTLSEIYCAENRLEFDHDAPEFPLDLIHYRKIHSEIILKNKEERLKIPGMIEMRVDMIVVASCLINFVINKMNIRNIRVSSHSLKEGMLDLIRKELYHQVKIAV